MPSLSSMFTADQLAAIQEMIRTGSTDGNRSPMKPRQLHDLRLVPKHDDPRPLFIWSAESPRDEDVSRTYPYPRLLWHRDTGQEITVRDEAAHRTYGEDWIESPPTATAVDPVEALEAVLDKLSEEDRTAIIEAQRQERLTVLKNKMAALSQEDLDRLVGGALTAARTEAKRGPGRPKKAVNE